ncbi:MAG: MBL fold metallo-hydrolase [Eubacteriales bacterium]
MNLIEFFGTTIKPKQTNGKKLWYPCETSQISENLFAIRDKDVNLFLIKSETGYIAIDSGYKNSENVRNGLKKLQISPTEIKAVFLTHLDLDHAGGVDAYSEHIFPNCVIYLSREEEQYLTGKLFRKKILGIGLASPVQLINIYKLVDDNQTVTVDGVTVTAISTPGHTMGHTSYLVSDELLFVGDLLIIGDDGGYCFMDFWNADSSINMVSLEKAYTIATKKDVDLIITSHSGINNDIEFAFQHRLKMPAWKEKGFVFRKDAPENPYTS